ncbi:bifunctional adenosylcobinamide kinase/adenosylcobinamide-phosphate guanylyltransferase [Aneurinibacillus uraniidurans]|uniref:bifunctional adenosylcobinamide kinase/adenosylcobinamide-phosphate guanylyltransferase n=1 Tax=Aneurinibacillus uraniidurans TaxID=2966586 RepID=UPI00234A0343|nr:bifunctional adenosylcobinamide kinase/adenosylcobinamide-phosphate guanylyltransferase [Aneurinibacillus sp. B1]WCN38293.1 bifunctional adenosylcobinamide kinase/adenosylcobinamide-phosphate guanylyltransferase [Aneurinibacillus sp. B1]
MSIIMVTGGVRSGKSAFAEQLAGENGTSVLYIATGVNTDIEMEERIALHRARRPEAWGLLETPLDIVGPAGEYENYETVLFDCVSTWITNQLLAVPEEEWRAEVHTRNIIAQADAWLERLRTYKGCAIIVSSETGLGGVAMSRLGRWFQDVLGTVNQRIATQADEVYAVLSGIPLCLKGERR